MERDASAEWATSVGRICRHRRSACGARRV